MKYVAWSIIVVFALVLASFLIIAFVSAIQIILDKDIAIDLIFGTGIITLILLIPLFGAIVYLDTTSQKRKEK